MTVEDSWMHTYTETGPLYGADADVVREAIERDDPLPGTSGFAGSIDGRLVRDVLGRVPLYVEGANGDENVDAIDERRWSFSPVSLVNPKPFPAGSICPHNTSDGSFAPERRWRLPDPVPATDRDACLERLTGAITSATDGVATGADVAIAFSGGVDSALLASLLDAPLYVAGFPGSHDVEAARSAAAAMDRLDALTVVDLDLDRLERAVPTVAREIGRTNAMDVAIALPLYLIAARADADGFDRLVVGQGADELFGGYEKVARLDHRVEATTIRGAVREQIATLPEQLPRDVLAVRAGGCQPVAPYLHDVVVDAALHLPTALLVDDGVRKRALREIAIDHLPESVATREKKAVQYGSLVARELDRLARRAGYKRRMDDHVSTYVRSRLE